jgi:hypothetical protein
VEVSSNDSNGIISLPINWKDNQVIRDNIIKACPWCFQENIENNKIGNLEHLSFHGRNIVLLGYNRFCNTSAAYEFNSVGQGV